MLFTPNLLTIILIFELSCVRCWWWEWGKIGVASLMIFWMNKDPGMTSYDPKKCCMIKCRKLNSGVSNIKKEKRNHHYYIWYSPWCIHMDKGFSFLSYWICKSAKPFDSNKIIFVSLLILFFVPSCFTFYFVHFPFDNAFGSKGSHVILNAFTWSGM